MDKVSGRCYYKMTVNGNLWGEYSNNEEKEIYAESATRMDDNGSERNWAGKYRSAWWEKTKGKEKMKGAILEIEPSKGNAKLFTIKWIAENGKPFMQGEAMLCDDILVVDYNNQ